MPVHRTLDDMLANASVDELIDYINFNYEHEETRSRILLAAVLMRLERVENKLNSQGDASARTIDTHANQ